LRPYTANVRTKNHRDDWSPVCVGFSTHPTISKKLVLSAQIALKYPDAQGLAQSLGKKTIILSGPAVMLGSVRLSPGGETLLTVIGAYIADVLFGFGSTVDVSYLNAFIRHTLLPHPLPSLLGIYLTIAVACFGLLKGRRPVGIIASQ